MDERLVQEFEQQCRDRGGELFKPEDPDFSPACTFGYGDSVELGEIMFRVPGRPGGIASVWTERLREKSGIPEDDRWVETHEVGLIAGRPSEEEGEGIQFAEDFAEENDLSLYSVDGESGSHARAENEIAQELPSR